jgi:hydroxymethylpyrimidine/phosphomethylpyrimidine kinase
MHNAPSAGMSAGAAGKSARATKTPVALSIAGSDPSGGAGIHADLKTFHQFGVYGEAVITLITVQNTVRVSRVEVLEPELVAQQIEAVIEDIPPQAAKTGALGSADMVQWVAMAAERFTFPLVVDPVMISKHGLPLLDDAAVSVMSLLLPRATLVTPNIPEAEALTREPIRSLEDMQRAAQKLHSLGARAVLIKGGHLEGGDATDILFDGEEYYAFPSERIATRHTHGTGCTYSAAITAGLALGFNLVEAVGQAKQFITEAIRTNPGLGRGSGPVNHRARVK